MSAAKINKLMADTKVSQRVSALQAAIAERAEVNAAFLYAMRELEELRADCQAKSASIGRLEIAIREAANINMWNSKQLFSLLENEPGSNVVFHFQEGDSLTPAIPRGAIAIVDTSVRHWEKSGFYLLNLFEDGSSSRVRQQIFHIGDRGVTKEHAHEHWISYPNRSYDSYWAAAETLKFAGRVTGSIHCLQR